MLANHDEPIPPKFDKEAMAKQMEEINKPLQATVAK